MTWGWRNWAEFLRNHPDTDDTRRELIEYAEDIISGRNLAGPDPLVRGIGVGILHILAKPYADEINPADD